MSLRPRCALVVVVTALSSGLFGCASGGTSIPVAPSTPAVAPAITTQPASLNVPISLDGIFSVGASGSPLSYQWSLNGTPIAGATSATYTTPAVALTDSGGVYTVTVSNSAGSITSQPATLTASARAPKNGDIRFQQVDSLNTINGYNGIEHSNINGGIAQMFTYATGSPLTIDTGECIALPVPSNDPYPCSWFFNSWYQPSGQTPLAIGYSAHTYNTLQNDLASGVFAGNGFGDGSLLAANTVITSLSLLPAYGEYALAYTQTSSTDSFNLAQRTVDASQLTAAAAQEGQSSRVITAISFDTGGITYFSYSWSADTTTVYDTLTATATFTTAPTVASSLAGQGYIITAIGGDAANGIVMVGTRVHGDSLARQIILFSSAQSPNYVSGGYAIVGIIGQSATGGGNVVIAER